MGFAVVNAFLSGIITNPPHADHVPPLPYPRLFFLPAIFHLVVVGLVTQKAGVQVVHQFSGQLVIIYIGPVVVFLLQTEGADRIRSLARTQYCVSINRRA